MFRERPHDRQGRLDGFILLTYLAMVWLCPWPSHAQRLLLPLVPLLAAHGYIFLAEAKPGWRRLLPIALCVVLFPTWAQIATRAAIGAPEGAHEYLHSRFWLGPAHIDDATADVKMRAAVVNALLAIRLYVPPEDCIAATHPQLVLLHGQRISLPPGAGHACRFRYVMRSTSFDRELLNAARDHEVLFSRRLPDGTPIGTLLKKTD